MKYPLYLAVSITLICISANQGLSQTWLPVGYGINCTSNNYVSSLNLNENNDALLISGMIDGTSETDGVCDTLLATLMWNGEHYSEIADQYTTNLSMYVFEFQGKTYGSGYLNYIGAGFNVKNQAGSWEALQGSFSGGYVVDHCIYNNTVYLSGMFSSAGGQPCSLVSYYDGLQFFPVFYHPSLQGDATYAVTVYQDTLFVGGDFGGISQQHTQQGYGFCAKIVEGQLQKLGQGFVFPSSGRTLEQMNGKLYMGGIFTPLGSNQTHTVMYYENGQVHALPSSPNALVYAMKHYNGGLYVVGQFTSIGNMPCYGVARYDDQGWTCLCNQPIYSENIPLRDLEIWNDTLYIGGGFDRIGNTTLKRIAKLDMALSEAFPVSVAKNQRHELKLNVYPNPATSELNITLPIVANAKDFIAVYDMQGRLIERQVVGKYAGSIFFDISRFSAGMYVLKYEGIKMMLVQQFIKQ